MLEEATTRLEALSQREQFAGLRRVINATGVVLHTNLGRAPLSAAARNAIANEAAGYCTLEYDVETGGRGKRAGRAEELLRQLTGAEAALVVNNCASAALAHFECAGARRRDNRFARRACRNWWRLPRPGRDVKLRHPHG